jgi:hypothetical protein
VESNWVHLALRPLMGLSCQARVIVMLEKLAGRLVGETEALGENLPQCRFVHHKSHMLPGGEPGLPRWEASDLPLELQHGHISTTNPTWCPDATPGRRGGKTATNRLSYGTALYVTIDGVWIGE